MTDPYGIGAAAKMGLNLFENASRGSGRTEATVKMCRPGDAIIVPKHSLRRHYMHAISDAGMRPSQEYDDEAVAVIVIDPKGDHHRQKGTNPRGRAFLSHEFYLELHEAALARVSRDADQIVEDLSKRLTTPKADRMKYQAMRDFAWSEECRFTGG